MPTSFLEDLISITRHGLMLSRVDAARFSILSFSVLLFMQGFIISYFGVLVYWKTEILRAVIIRSVPMLHTPIYLFFGFYTVIIGGLGFYGSVRKHLRALFVFAFLVLIYSANKLTLGLSVYFNRMDFKYLNSYDTYKKIFSNYWTKETHFINYIQAYWSCCGVDGPDDFKTGHYPNMNDTIPWSCCKIGPQLRINDCVNSKIIKDGCIPVLNESLEFIRDLYYLAFCFVPLEIIIIALTLYLVRTIKNANYQPRDSAVFVTIHKNITETFEVERVVDVPVCHSA